MYNDMEMFKMAGIFGILFLLYFVPIKIVDATTTVQDQKITELKNQLADKDARIVVLEKMQPPKPVDYSFTLLVALIVFFLLVYAGIQLWHDIEIKKLEPKQAPTDSTKEK